MRPATDQVGPSTTTNRASSPHSGASSGTSSRPESSPPSSATASRCSRTSSTKPRVSSSSTTRASSGGVAGEIGIVLDPGRYVRNQAEIIQSPQVAARASELLGGEPEPVGDPGLHVGIDRLRHRCHLASLDSIHRRAGGGRRGRRRSRVRGRRRRGHLNEGR